MTSTIVASGDDIWATTSRYKTRTANMGFSAMLAEEYKLIDISLIGYIMVRLFFVTSIEIYSAS